MNAAYLALCVRTVQLAKEQVDTDLNDERSIVRSWLMRGTLHLVAADDLRWMLQLLGPLMTSGNTARQRQLGLDEDLKVRGVAAIRRTLAATGPLTRYEIVDRLRRLAIDLDAKTQAPIHLIQLAALEGVCCLGPDRENGEPTYVLIDDWLGKPSRTPSAPAGELAHRYFAAFGPATLADFAAWSGLPMAQARSAVAATSHSLDQVTIGTQPAFVVAGASVKRQQLEANVRLVPAFDGYLLGYRSRDLAVPPRLQRRLQRGGGWIHPAVLVDGRVVAAWSSGRVANKAEILIEAPGKLDDRVAAGIEAEAKEISRFLKAPIALKLRGLAVKRPM